jgi:hypothetical protein
MIDLNPAQGPRLVLQFSVRDGDVYARAVESPEGETAARFAADVPIDLPPLNDVWQMAGQPVFHDEAGRRLFGAVMAGDLRDLYGLSRRLAAESQATLTLELRFDRSALHLAQYPWELLHDDVRFLLASDTVNLVRSVPFPESVHPFAPRRTFEVLLAEVNGTAGFNTLQASLADAMAFGPVDLAYLMPPSWESLMDWLLAGAPDVLHFMGQGDAAGAGLLFEREMGGLDPVSAARLGDALYSTRLRLLILSAAVAARDAGEPQLAAVAPALVVAGIPAVVAMQGWLPDDALTAMMRALYRALRSGYSLETAVLMGRMALRRSTYWHAPTLLVRARSLPGAMQPLRHVWIDTAAPQIAPVRLPLRIGVWVREGGSPPDADTVRRLIGCPLHERSRDSAVGQGRITPAAGPITSGPAEVRINAPGCEVHVSHRAITLTTDDTMPPVWMPITPRQTGLLEVRVELVQNEQVIAAVVHPIQVVAEEAGQVAARVESRRVEWLGADAAAVDRVARPERQTGETDSSATGEYSTVGSATPSPDEPVRGQAAPAVPADEPDRESEHDYDPQRESDIDLRQARDVVVPPPVSQDRGVHEALDGVLDWLQAGEQPVRDDDDPLAGSGEFVRDEDSFERFPVDEPESPLVKHVLDHEPADRPPPEGSWVYRVLDDVEDAAALDRTVIGDADVIDEPTVILDDSPWRMVGDTPDTAIEDAPDDAPEAVREDTAEDTPVDMPEEAPGTAAEFTPEDAWEDVPDDTPDTAIDDTPDNATGHGPPDVGRIDEDITDEDWQEWLRRWHGDG